MNHIGPELTGEKLLLALDLDGVLYRWTEAAIDTLHDLRGLGPDHYGEDTHWDQIKEHVSDDDWHYLWNARTARKRMFRTGRSYADGVRAARELEKITTTVMMTRRPPDAAADTMAWIATHRLNPHGLLVIGGGTKHEHPFAKDFDLLVDDNPDVARGWRDEVGTPVFMPARPYNAECVDEEGITRFEDWAVVINWVKERG